MTSLFARALGDSWETLHPQIRDRYGVESGDGREVLGTGTMDEVAGSRLALPVLWLGTADDFLFPESGTDVPFTIRTEAFVDDRGFEALYLERSFSFGREREFVDTLRWNPERGCITDLLGSRGLVVSDLHLDVDDGDLVLTLGEQWLRLGGRYVPIPGPLAATGTLRDWFDDEAGRFTVAAEIEGPLPGPLFRYHGTFENEHVTAGSGAAPTSRLGSVSLPGAND